MPSEIDISDGSRMTSPFDRIRHTDEAGEFWLARELGPELGYRGRGAWKNIESIVAKVCAMAVLNGGDPDNLVSEVGKNSSVYTRDGRPGVDYRLTRRACYMFAVCSDERKPEVAAAKNYFVVMTREAEMAPRPTVVNVVHPWAERFNRIYKKHFCFVSRNFAPGCFSMITKLLGNLLVMEDEFLRHQFELLSSDMPDGSIGRCWSNHITKVAGECGRAPLYLPDKGITVYPAVWPEDLQVEFDRWYSDNYVSGPKLRNYVHGKFKRKYGPLPCDSVTNGISIELTGRDSKAIPPPALGMIKYNGGTIKVGQIIGMPQKQLEFV